MATPKKSATDTPKVTRITASDSNAPRKKLARSSSKPSIKTHKTTLSSNPKKAEVEHSSSKNPLRAITAYFKGAWHELQQVRWPDRAATWGMTGALLAFTAGFVVVILLLDALFKYVFQLILE